LFYNSLTCEHSEASNASFIPQPTCLPYDQSGISSKKHNRCPIELIDKLKEWLALATERCQATKDG
jgi:hypothetical protein